jgi:uncharacterized protein (TIGR03067 family)
VRTRSNVIAEVSIDPAINPSQLDFKVTEGPLKGSVVAGIYHLDGDELKLCYSTSSKDKDRPLEFKGKPDKGIILLTLKREKP